MLNLNEAISQSDIDHWVKYAGQKDFESEEEARGFIARKANQGTAWTYGIDNPEEYYKQLAMEMPVYQTKKGWRLGTPQAIRRMQQKRSRKKNPPLSWKTIKIVGSSLHDQNVSASAQEESDYEIMPIKFYRIAELLPDEDNYYMKGQEGEYIKELAQKIKQNRWFEAIYVHENERYIIEGQHRTRALRLLRLKTVPGYGFLYDRVDEELNDIRRRAGINLI